VWPAMTASTGPPPAILLPLGHAAGGFSGPPHSPRPRQGPTLHGTATGSPTPPHRVPAVACEPHAPVNDGLVEAFPRTLGPAPRWPAATWVSSTEGQPGRVPHRPCPEHSGRHLAGRRPHGSPPPRASRDAYPTAPNPSPRPPTSLPRTWVAAGVSPQGLRLLRRRFSALRGWVGGRAATNAPRQTHCRATGLGCGRPRQKGQPRWQEAPKRVANRGHRENA